MQSVSVITKANEFDSIRSMGAVRDAILHG